jgi:hypothetical protein
LMTDQMWLFTDPCCIVPQRRSHALDRLRCNLAIRQLSRGNHMCASHQKMEDQAASQ